MLTEALVRRSSRTRSSATTMTEFDFQSGAEGTVEGNDIHSNRLAQISVSIPAPGPRSDTTTTSHVPGRCHSDQLEPGIHVLVRQKAVPARRAACVRLLRLWVPQVNAIGQSSRATKRRASAACASSGRVHVARLNASRSSDNASHSETSRTRNPSGSWSFRSWPSQQALDPIESAAVQGDSELVGRPARQPAGELDARCALGQAARSSNHRGAGSRRSQLVPRSS